MVEARGREDRFNSDQRSRSDRLVARRRKVRKSGPRRRAETRSQASAKSQGGRHERKVAGWFAGRDSVGDQCERCGRLATPYLSQRKNTRYLCILFGVVVL